MPPQMSRNTGNNKKPIKKGAVRQNYKTIREGYVKTVTDNSGNLKPVKELPRMERTFIMIKPDAVQRQLIGKIMQRFQQKGFILVAMKFMIAPLDLLRNHYSELSTRPFFPNLIKYMSSGPVVPMVWEGIDVIKTTRQMLGQTNPFDSMPGTIRGDFGIQSGRNIIHGSDSVDSAFREIFLWFNDDELVSWSPAVSNFVMPSN